MNWVERNPYNCPNKLTNDYRYRAVEELNCEHCNDKVCEKVAQEVKNEPIRDF